MMTHYTSIHCLNKYLLAPRNSLQSVVATYTVFKPCEFAVVGRRNRMYSVYIQYTTDEKNSILVLITLSFVFNLNHHKTKQKKCLS